MRKVKRRKASKVSKKKGSGKYSTKRANSEVPELLRGVRFSVARNGLNFYSKSLDKLQLYDSTTFKNGADV